MFYWTFFIKTFNAPHLLMFFELVASLVLFLEITRTHVDNMSRKRYITHCHNVYTLAQRLRMTEACLTVTREYIPPRLTMVAAAVMLSEY